MPWQLASQSNVSLLKHKIESLFQKLPNLSYGSDYEVPVFITGLDKRSKFFRVARKIKILVATHVSYTIVLRWACNTVGPSWHKK